MKIINPISGAAFRKPFRRGLPCYIILGLLFLTYTQFKHVDKFQQVHGDVLKRIYAYRKAYHMPTKFPKKIWQTWKTDPLEFEDRDANRARSWPQKNPGYRYEVLTDGNDLDYVVTHFGPGGEVYRPDIVEIYRTLQATIIKADLLRYLVMYVEGGVYADIDVENLRGVATWIPGNFSEADIDLVIGVEIDEPTYINHTILGPKSESFCQWTFMTKPRHPVLLRIIEHVIHWLNEVSQNQHVPIGNITLNFDEVITGTGPSAFTGSILNEMAAQTGKRPPWETFHNLQEPVQIGNILVLTVEAFAAGQGHSNSGNHDSPKALIKHHYHASLWPSRHPRYSHPAYGMVEECNWARDCVGNWTANTAVYDSLPQEEKDRLLKEKKRIDAERFDKEEKEKKDHEREDREKKDAETKKTCEAASYVHSSVCETCRTDVCRTVTEAFKNQTVDANGMMTILIPGDQLQDEGKKDDSKKGDENKDKDKKPDEKKPDEKKPDEKKSEEKKPEEKKPDVKPEQHGDSKEKKLDEAKVDGRS